MIWAYAIDGLKPEQIAQGIKNLARRDSEFPPSCGQFRDLCLMDMDWEHKQLKYIAPTGIEDQTAKAAQRANGIDQLRKLRESTGL